MLFSSPVLTVPALLESDVGASLFLPSVSLISSSVDVPELSPNLSTSSNPAVKAYVLLCVIVNFVMKKSKA